MRAKRAGYGGRFGEADDRDRDRGDDQIGRGAPLEIEPERDEAAVERADDRPVVSGQGGDRLADDDRDEDPGEQGVEPTAAEDQGQREHGECDRDRLPLLGVGQRPDRVLQDPAFVGGDVEDLRELR